MDNFSIDQYADVVVDSYKQLKVYMCDSNLDGSRSPIPIIQWMNADGEVQVIGFDLEIPQLSQVISSLREELGVPYAVAFSSDAHFRVMSNDVESIDSMNNYKRGKMREDFHQGDMTVKDALIVVVCTSFTFRSIMVEYAYDDSGLPVFDNSVVSDTAIGLISNSLAEAFVSLN